jgi:hypothetical protein
MRYTLPPCLVLALVVAADPGASQTTDNIPASPLVVAAGTPLRVYLTKRLSKRLGEPVEAKLLDPLYAFDREVAPAGSQVLGTVVRIEPATKMQRASAMVGGDFTSLHQAEVEFTTLVLPDGRRIPLRTVETEGLNSIADFNPNKKSAAANQNPGILSKAKAQVQDKIDSARKSVSDVVRAPDKKERLEDFLWSKLPYHPQRVRRGTRFDAELMDPLQFGSASRNPDDLRLLGSQPPTDSSVQARLTTPLGSESAKQGDRVEAVVTRPLFSSDHKLLLPEGTRLTGAVTTVRRARWLHRGGQLRFTFQTVELPEGFPPPGQPAEKPAMKTFAMLQATEPDGKTAVKVDEEGGVKATEPKTRFIAPVVAALLANRAADHDVNKRTGLVENNTGGQTLGGASGFGLLGAVASRISPNVASALGFYGLAWSVYLNVVSRGGEVEFQKNAAIDVRFGARAPEPAPKLNAIRSAVTPPETVQ